MFDNEDDLKEYLRYQRRHAIEQMFIPYNLSWEIKDDHSFISRWFYFSKALICLLLKRFGHKGYGLFVITYDEYQCIDSTNWEYVSVGYGVFTNWKVNIGSDGA